MDVGASIRRSSDLGNSDGFIGIDHNVWAATSASPLVLPTQGGCSPEPKVLLVRGNENRKEKRRRVASTSLEREVTIPASTRKKLSTSPKLFRKENRQLNDELEEGDQKIAQVKEEN